MLKYIVITSLTFLLGAFQVLAGPIGEGAKPGESTDGMEMQKARAGMMTVRGQRIGYTTPFDLSGLPAYEPKQSVSGTLRLWGSNYITDGYIGGYWAEKFKEYHPDINFEWDMKTSRGAAPSLVYGVSDIGIARKITFGELQLFQRYTDHSPIEIELATGSFDIPGWQPGYGVLVHPDNPLTQISMEQLDGIFGAERTGGWDGTSWRPDWARGPEKNIRTWGELGLTGEWADQPINVYGLNLRYHQAEEISDFILKSSDKWNERLRIYANYVTADGKLARNMDDDLALDKWGIGVFAAPTVNLGGDQTVNKLKLLPLGRTNEGPFIPYTLETLQNRTYPMYDEIYAYADAEPADPKVIEFLRFIVSREGQELVMKDAKYLPLTAQAAKAQLDKLNAAMP
ncbi:MAG: phosphate transport system substrate-binding protein [Lysobacterales bacterium]|jgi:phosphate transport system substrate-binding protein